MDGRAVRALLFVLCLALAGCSTPAERTEEVRVLAALGDSITRAANAAGPGERPAASWATGHDARDNVWSLAERLVNASPGLSGNVHNFAASGAAMRDLPAQARRAVDAGADAVVLLMGANDACRGRVEDMTSVEDFRVSFAEAADALRGLPEGAVVYVVGVPDVTAVWDAGKDNPAVRERWRAVGACPVVLGESATDADRAEVAARVEAFNRALTEESARRGFATDGLAVFRSGVAVEHLSPFDAFHPSLAGQAALADVAWAASPWAER